MKTQTSPPLIGGSQKVFSKLLPYRETQDPLPEELILAAIHESAAGPTAKEYRDIANTILSGAGYFVGREVSATY